MSCTSQKQPRAESGAVGLAILRAALSAPASAGEPGSQPLPTHDLGRRIIVHLPAWWLVEAQNGAAWIRPALQYRGVRS